MARDEHLAMYRKAFGPLVYLETTVAGFSKAHRFGLGLDLGTLAQRIVQRVVRTNASPVRATDLAELRLEVLQGALRPRDVVAIGRPFRRAEQQEATWW